jgi:Tfp pilus assembly protein PilZ
MDNNQKTQNFTMNNSFVDKREAQRKQCAGIKVTYSMKDRLFNDPIDDISENGLFITTNEKFSPGKKITLTFMSFHKKGPILMKGNIVRTEKKGIGIKFFDTDEVQKNALSTFMNGYLV